MASGSVTGKTASELRALRESFDQSPKSDHYAFEGWYCLAKIPRQPAEYDGPERFCVLTELERYERCKFHGGAGDANPENLEVLANMKHGMKATRENLISDFSAADQRLYDWITQDWPGAYEIDLAEDPQAEYEFHALAVEIVRAERAEGFIIERGEENEKKVFGPDGSVHFEEVPHYLVDMLQRQRKLIMQMEDSLGISRKKRLQNEQATDATAVMKSFAEVGVGLISGDDTGYDPAEWDPEEGQADDGD